MKNKRILKAAAFLTAILLIIGVCILANMFVGNPVSRVLASKAAKEYLESDFKDIPYFVDRVDYSFKNGRYYARISLPNSTDNHFNISFNSFGERGYCDYETMVINRENTANRLFFEYQSSVIPILETVVNDANGMLLFDRSGQDESSMSPCDLELDGVYDVMELGGQFGWITADVETTDVTPQNAAKYLLEIKRVMDEAGAGFSKVSLYLRWIDGEVFDSTKTLYLFDFPYSEIYEENLDKRIQDAMEKAKQN